jgi:DNA mismatch repair protein MutL
LTRILARIEGIHAITASPPIRLLDSNTVNQIAAGEVVERPASVVKELVENSIDSGADHIEIELVDSGRTLIRVSDNGCGMGPEDARQCLQRHATSKIGSSEDLLDVATLGFRGEALPSIASVSRFTLRTSVQDGLRTVLTVQDGQTVEAAALSGPKGTEILVEDLFFNTPARLKFLKSDSTEIGQAIDHVSRYAIGYPGISFSLFHGPQLVLRTNGSGDRLEAISSVWGREPARALAPIDLQTAGMRLTGFVSPPHFTKSTRAYQYIFVNGRPVRTRTLTAAIDQSFRDITPDRRFPLMILSIDIDPAKVDVNVSPTKSEVKFQHEGGIFDAVRLAVKGALFEHGMMPDAAGIAAANEALAALRKPAFPLERESQPPYTVNSVEPPLELTRFPSDPVEMSASSAPAAEIFVPAPSMPFGNLLDRLRIVGQVMNTFIVAETAGGVVIVDQHVAHERILYEYLCGLKGSTAIEKQPLLVPQMLNLDRRSALLLQDRIKEVEEVGFDLEPFGGECYVVRAVPAAIRNKDPLKILGDIVEELIESTAVRKLVPTRERIWITSACHMAVKAGDPLSHTEMEKLIYDLATTENPYLCPHGRPITITLSKDAIMRLFKRT